MRVLFVASECFPLIKTGGLADVVGSQPPVLAAAGCDVKVLLPGYRGVMAALGKARPLQTLKSLHGGPAKIRAAKSGDLSVLALDAPHLYDRDGGPYTRPDGADWPDNHLRFAALSRAAAMIGTEGIDGWVPDIVHAHDWQAGLVPVYLQNAKGQRPKSVFTIHNIAYQGTFPPGALADIDLPPTEFTPERLEFYGQVSFLKAGMVAADHVTTVSPTYAREIRTSDFGYGLEGVLNARAADLSGILNGIDEDVWNPKTDASLAANYSARNLKRREANRTALRKTFGLNDDPAAPLIAVVSRLAHQKGLDVLLDALPHITGRGGQFALLGSGDAGLESAYGIAAGRYPGQVGIRIGYDEALSHLIYGGADALVIPSRFEPCGLTQLYALRYGCVPVVARTGGLADTIIDANPAAIGQGAATGIQFTPVTAEALGFALERLFALFADKPAWRMIQTRAMSQDVGWSQSAERYLELYRALTGASAR